MPYHDKNDTALNTYSSVYVRELEIDDLAPVFHLGEDLLTSASPTPRR